MVGRPVAIWLAHTGVLAGISAASAAITASILMRAPARPALALVAFAATLLSYWIDRRVDRARDGHALRSATLAGVRGVMAVFLGLFALAVALAVIQVGPAAGVVLLGIPLAVVLYAVPWLDRLAPPLRRRGIRRVKDIPLAKAFYVAACWLVLVPLAALFTGRALDWGLVPVALAMFGFLFVNVVACDLRDIAADRAAGVVTFPVLLGPARTVRALRWFNALWVVALGVALVAGVLPCAAVALALQAAIVDRCLVRVAEPGADLTFYGDVCFDCTVAVLPLLFVVVALAGRILGCHPMT